MASSASGGVDKVTEPVCTFIKKPRSRKSIQRKRKEIAEDVSSEDETQVIRKDRKVDMMSPMIHNTSIKKKKLEVIAHSDSDEESAVAVSYKSKRLTEMECPKDMGATAVLEIDTEKSRDAQAIFERAQKVNQELKGKTDDKVYRGINNYVQYIIKKDTAQGNASSGMVRKGPIRAPQNIRSTVRWDYQPDICKDYKETGFCGFGESCKFMHDRSDYKHGWQLELEMERDVYGEEDTSRYEIASDEEDLPFKCYICRKSFTDPIVTKCGHYFCEKCALKQYRKRTRCVVCGQQTMGVFNPAKELIQRLKRKEAEDAEKDDSEGNEECRPAPSVNQDDGNHSTTDSDDPGGT